MIDAICVFTKGGVVLWSYYFIRLKSDSFNTLIRTVLIEDRIGRQSASIDSLNLQWHLINKLDLVFVVAYKGIQSISRISDLLQTVAAEFVAYIGDPATAAQALQLYPVNFNERFFKVLDKRELAHQKAATKVKEKQAKGTSASRSAPEGGEAAKTKSGIDKKCDQEMKTGNNSEPKNGKKKGKTTHEAAGGKKTTKPTRKAGWQEASTWQQKVTKKAMDELDRTAPSASGDVTGSDDVVKPAMDDYGAAEDVEYSDEDELDNDTSSSDGGSDSNLVNEESSSGIAATAKGIWTSLGMAVKNVTGNADLTQGDLDSSMVAFRETLLAKNVANDITDQIVESVKVTLLGQKTARWTSVKATVKAEMAKVIGRILTPKKSVDVLKAALEAKSRGQVYSICFLGVNGVGKSTNLAKVCYFLKQKGGLNVMIAACDTFRSGAVEQLRTHARCLGVHLFERGYGKDPSAIAQQAIAHAKTNAFDVVLIDTAGRMQDNEPLMRALAKLVNVNRPDLILFVGEALVGNDAIDQLAKFNQCLIDGTACGSKGGARTVDGILLTKFDTVDDKVGAALSMVYLTGQPIVFIGTGQKYTQLRKLNVSTVVKALLN